MLLRTGQHLHHELPPLGDSNANSQFWLQFDEAAAILQRCLQQWDRGHEDAVALKHPIY